jgi:hypothetical protein
MIIPECFCGTLCTKPCPFIKEVLQELKEVQQEEKEKENV